jgi:DNA polymerase phi
MDETKAQGSITGQEERDILFARLFGITSIIQSGLLVRTGALTTSASFAAQASTVSSYEEAISQLLILGKKKSWLRESAWWTIALAVDALEESSVGWKDGAIDVTLQHLFIENKIWSPEKVALALKLQSLHPDRDWRKFFSPSFKNPDLLNTSNLQNLARILKVIISVISRVEVNKKPYYRNPQWTTRMQRMSPRPLRALGNPNSIMSGI